MGRRCGCRHRKARGQRLAVRQRGDWRGKPKCAGNGDRSGCRRVNAGELHKLWRTGAVDGYHMEYGFSCMGYEVSAGIGVHMASPDRPNVVFAGDGSYLMMNSELATAVMMGVSMTLVVTDNRGYGCINRLQVATGGAPFNNLLADAHHEILPEIDFAAHAASLGARSQKVSSLDELEEAVLAASGRAGSRCHCHRYRPGTQY